MSTKRKYEPRPRTMEIVIEEKIKILTEFGIVDKHNESDIRTEFLIELRGLECDRLDPAADRIAKRVMHRAWNNG